MNLAELKQKALDLKNKALDYSSKQLADSVLTIDSKEKLDAFIQKSENKTFTNKETGIKKLYKKRVLVIFGEESSDFFKQALYMLPILITKGFSQNTPVILAKSTITDTGISEFPSLIVYENKQKIKTITGAENILKLVKSFDLDINKVIDTLK